MRGWARLVALLFVVAVGGCDTIHGSASADGGSGGNTAATRSGLFMLGSGIRF